MRGFSDIWTELSSILPSPLPIGDLRGMRSLEKQEPGQAVPDFPGLDRGSKYCCPVPPWLAPHPSIASRKQIFRRSGGARWWGQQWQKENSRRRGNEKEIIRPRMGTWRGCTLVYSGNDKHCKFRDGRNDIVQAEASSQQAVNQKKTSTNPFYIAFILCYKMCYSKKLGSGHYNHAK